MTGKCSLFSNVAGDYTIIVSTYDAGLCGDFKLTVACNSEFQINEIPPEGAVCTWIYVLVEFIPTERVLISNFGLF